MRKTCCFARGEQSDRCNAHTGSLFPPVNRKETACDTVVRRHPVRCDEDDAEDEEQKDYDCGDTHKCDFVMIT